MALRPRLTTSLPLSERGLSAVGDADLFLTSNHTQGTLSSFEAENGLGVLVRGEETGYLYCDPDTHELKQYDIGGHLCGYIVGPKSVQTFLTGIQISSLETACPCECDGIESLSVLSFVLQVCME